MRNKKFNNNIVHIFLIYVSPSLYCVALKVYFIFTLYMDSKNFLMYEIRNKMMRVIIIKANKNTLTCCIGNVHLTYVKSLTYIPIEEKKRSIWLIYIIITPVILSVCMYVAINFVTLVKY